MVLVLPCLFGPIIHQLEIHRMPSSIKGHGK